MELREFMLKIHENINVFKCKELTATANDPGVVEFIPRPELYWTLRAFPRRFTLVYLKEIARHYQLAVSGTRDTLIMRIYIYLGKVTFATRIQQCARGWIARRFIALHQFELRKQCNNQCDFVTMNELADTYALQTIYYRDRDGFVYGFDVSSLHRLLLHATVDNELQWISTLNPYTRSPFPADIMNRLAHMMRMGALLSFTSVQWQSPEVVLSPGKRFEMKVIALFQQINMYGNHAEYTWFMKLSVNQLIRFIEILIDIWEYRAELTQESKECIYPYGNPFANELIEIFFRETRLIIIRETVIRVITKLVTCGINEEWKSLGATYVLGGLTIVCPEAATSLPWLHQAFML
jgi:hypothetical protein